MLLAAIALIPMPQIALVPLDRYLSARDDSFRVGPAKLEGAVLRADFTSQTWQGIAWRHRLTIVQPRERAASGTAILIVTGDLAARDEPEARRLADLSGLPVVTLFDVPNQPLWGKSEDALIAHTFVKWFETQDDSWPLLFPMTKSALRAMDVAQSLTGEGPNPIQRFVVTGASKRGWTTWLVGAARDKRVIGIAPQVFDFLNFGAQLEHQKRSFGGYSEMLGDYTEQELQETASSPEGQKLIGMVDPFAYRSRITLPKLIITGANDQYWTVDATRLYWDALSGPKWALAVPNAGHGLGDGKQAEATLAEFARALATGEALPTLELKQGMSWSSGGTLLKLHWKASERPIRIVLHRAQTEPERKSLDFRSRTWSPLIEKEPDGTSGELTATHSSFQNAAFILEAVFERKGRRFSVTAPALVSSGGNL